MLRAASDDTQGSGEKSSQSQPPASQAKTASRIGPAAPATAEAQGLGSSGVGSASGACGSAVTVTVVIRPCGSLAEQPTQSDPTTNTANSHLISARSPIARARVKSRARV